MTTNIKVARDNKKRPMMNTYVAGISRMKGDLSLNHWIKTK
jgi:hypothetical protein